MLNFGPSLIKPARWPLQPHLTAAPRLATGAVFYPPLWENSGTRISDASSFNNVGTKSGPVWVSSSYGPALTFRNANSDKITVPNSDSVNISGVEVSCFVFLRPNGGDSYVETGIGKPHSTTHKSPYWKYFLGFNSRDAGRQVLGRIDSTEVKSQSAVLIENEYNAYFMVYDGSTIKLYRNNVEIGSRSKTGNIETAPTNLLVGANADDGEGLEATMVACGVFPFALNRTERQILSDDPFALIRPGPQAIPLLFGGAGATDTTPPQFQSAEVPASGDSVTVRFDDSLAGSTSAADWTVRDETNAEDETINSASISGTDVILSLGSTIYSGETVTLDYGGTTLEDTAGNQVASFSGEAVTNNSTATQTSNVAGDIAQTLPTLLQSASVVFVGDYNAAVTQTLPVLAHSASVSYSTVFTVKTAQTLPALTQYATAQTSNVAGDTTQTLPLLSQSASLVFVGDYNAAVTQSLPTLTQSVSGVIGYVSGVASDVGQSLPAVGQSASASYSIVFTTNTAQTLPTLAQSATAQTYIEYVANISQTLPALTQKVSLLEPILGSASNTLPAMRQLIDVKLINYRKVRRPPNKSYPGTIWR